MKIAIFLICLLLVSTAFGINKGPSGVPDWVSTIVGADLHTILNDPQLKNVISNNPSVNQILSVLNYVGVNFYTDINYALFFMEGINPSLNSRPRLVLQLDLKYQKQKLIQYFQNYPGFSISNYKGISYALFTKSNNSQANKNNSSFNIPDKFIIMMADNTLVICLKEELTEAADILNNNFNSIKLNSDFAKIITENNKGNLWLVFKMNDEIKQSITNLTKTTFSQSPILQVIVSTLKTINFIGLDIIKSNTLYVELTFLMQDANSANILKNQIQAIIEILKTQAASDQSNQNPLSNLGKKVKIELQDKKINLSLLLNEQELNALLSLKK